MSLVCVFATRRSLTCPEIRDRRAVLGDRYVLDADGTSNPETDGIVYFAFKHDVELMVDVSRTSY